MDMVMLHLTPNPNPTQSLTVNPLRIFSKGFTFNTLSNLMKKISNKPS